MRVETEEGQDSLKYIRENQQNLMKSHIGKEERRSYDRLGFDIAVRGLGFPCLRHCSQPAQGGLKCDG